MVWGVYAIVIPKSDSSGEQHDKSIKYAIDEGYIQDRDIVILTAGVPFGVAGNTNMMQVHVVGKAL
jgi:pyruvate kinase